MSVAFVQTVAQWSANGGPATSGAFTASSGDVLATFGAELTSASATLVFTGTGGGTWSSLNPPGNFADANGDTTGSGINLTIASGSQTVTVNTTINSVVIGWGYEYSGVASAVGSTGKAVNAPGTGSGAIVGTGVVVPTGSVLLALCLNVGTTGSLNISASPSGTNRGLAVTNLLNLSYCVTEYAGAGSSITPTFTTSSGGDLFDVHQILLSGPAGPPGTLAINLSGQTAGRIIGSIVRPATA